jgi:hypothetical protein
VQMLLQSIDGQSDSVFIDLLTYSDLELLKSRKTGKSEPASSAASKSNNKRYLIMTYAVEYDRVHYPLPLNFEEAPDPANLKMTISRLRQELADLKSSVVRLSLSLLVCAWFCPCFPLCPLDTPVEDEQLWLLLRRATGTCLPTLA